MKIVDVRARLLRAEPQVPVLFAAGRYEAFTAVLVEVTTEDGITGHGESIGRAGAAMTKAAVEHLLGPAIIGRDARDVGGLYQHMVAQLRRFGHAGGTVIEALSGIDIALWDAVGNAVGEPIWALMHGAGRRRVPCYASSVYIADYDNMCAQAVEQVGRGFGTVKLKIGRSPALGGIAGDVASVRAVREAVGGGVELGVDANSAYDAGTAVRVARGLEPLDIAFFEEPVHPDDLAGYERVHAMTGLPLAGGETFFLLYGFNELLRRRLVDIVQPDLGRCGGITGASHVATLALANNVRYAPHTGFSGGVSQLAAIHAAAAAPSLYLLEYMFIDNPLREIFVGGFPEATGGYVDTPTGPGLGLELDLDAIDRYTVADA